MDWETGGIEEAEGGFLIDAALPAIVFGIMLCPRGTAVEVRKWTTGSFFEDAEMLVLAIEAVEGLGA
jgi:hypothetical protein